jgi:hypothetical protein
VRPAEADALELFKPFHLKLFDAIGCRRFWPCLTDKSEGKPEAWMTTNGAAVVRVRAGSEVPRPAGVGSWQVPAPARYTDFRPMSAIGAQGTTATLVLSGSAVMSQTRSARAGTRFSASAQALRDDWQALGMTELLVLAPGVWSQRQVEEQVAMLCRVAPTWDRTLRWPSPIHLARAVVRDHPHEYFVEDDEEEGSGVDGSIRLDLGS